MIRVDAVLVTMIFASTACDSAVTDGPAQPAASPAEPAAPAAAEPGLPAWETPEELTGVYKGDEHDDYREAHPELYGVTAPPSQPVRSFAEYEPARALILRPGGGIGKFHRGIIEGAAGHVPLMVILHDTGKAAGLLDAVEDLGLDADGFQLLDVGDTDAMWARDYGPVSHVTADGEVGFVDFRYYHGRHWDDATPTKLAADWGVNVFRPSMSFEGGNFMADAAGTCYATEKIYQQNPGHAADEIDKWMREYAGCEQVVSLARPKGLGTGHIDMFAKLIDEGTVILGEYDPAVRPENAEILDETADMLEALTTAGGGGLEVHRIPLPWDETGVWYTYTNSLILNDVVLVPVYSKFKDLEAQAISVYAAAAPGLTVKTVNSDGVIPSGGAIHCVTMTVPEGTLAAYQEAPVQLCPLNELNKCDDPGPCGGLPYEGSCEGGVLQFCGADGYPHAATCEGCCGWDGEEGWYDCLAAEACGGCGDECAAEGDTGCSGLLTHAWICVQADGDPCLERVFQACGAEASCDEDIAICAEASPPECPGAGHQCDVLGARTCDAAGATALVCREDGDRCRYLAAVEECDAGAVCADGLCIPASPAGDALYGADAAPEDAPPPPGGGCTTTGGPDAVPWLILLVLVILPPRWGRCRRSRRRGDSQRGDPVRMQLRQEPAE